MTVLGYMFGVFEFVFEEVYKVFVFRAVDAPFSW